MEAREGGMRAPAPQLPPPRQDVLGAGVVTPPRREADRHGGICAPGTRLLQKGDTSIPSDFLQKFGIRIVAPTVGMSHGLLKTC